MVNMKMIFSSKIAGYRTSTIDINVMNCIYDSFLLLQMSFIEKIIKHNV